MVYGNGVLGAGRIVPQAEGILIERQRRGGNVRQRVGLNLRRRNLHHAGIGQSIAKALVIEEDEELVLADGAADRAAEPMRVRARLLYACLIVEEIIGVEDFVVVVVEEVAVETGWCRSCPPSSPARPPCVRNRAL